MHLLTEGIAVDEKPRTSVPEFRGGVPSERTLAPQRIDSVEHLAKTESDLSGRPAGQRLEPGTVIAILPLKLAIEAGMMGRPVQKQHAVFLQ